MKRSKDFHVLTLTGLIFVGLLACLAIASWEKDSCRTATAESGACVIHANSTVSSPVEPAIGPTLAPPRPETSAPIPTYANELATGNPVFVKVETDLTDLEVSWESP
jgi:hypothetical protein